MARCDVVRENRAGDFLEIKQCAHAYGHDGKHSFEPRQTFTAADLARARQAGFDEAREMAAKRLDLALPEIAADIRAMRPEAESEVKK